MNGRTVSRRTTDSSNPGTSGGVSIMTSDPVFCRPPRITRVSQVHGLDCHQKRRGAARETSSPCDFIPVCYRQPRAGSPRNCFVKKSGATHEFPRVGGHLDSFALFNEEGHANFNARFQLCLLGHVAARRISAGSGFRTSHN